MRSLCILEPLLALYRLPVYRALARRFETTLICSPSGPGAWFGVAEPAPDGIRVVEVPTHRLCSWPVSLVWQEGVVSTLEKIRPDAVIMYADLNYLSGWRVLSWRRQRRCQVFLH